MVQPSTGKGGSADGSGADTTGDVAGDAQGSAEASGIAGGETQVASTAETDAAVAAATDVQEESEPNNDIATADPISLDASGAGAVSGELPVLIVLPLCAPPPPECDPSPIGVVGEKDFFSFDVAASQQIHVELTGELIGKGGRLTLYDAAGVELTSDADASDGIQVDWTAEADGRFFVRVDRDPSAPRLGGDDNALEYVTSVMVQSPGGQGGSTLASTVEVDATPLVVIVDARHSFEFTDSSGDTVRIALRGRGQATVTFTDAVAAGADIASVVVASTRRGGGLVISSSGSAEVASVEIHGSAGLGRKSGFGKVAIDGNVGSLRADVNVRAVLIDGMLGGLFASGHVVGRLRAEVFDVALADVSAIASLLIDRE
jgi:hypothetical protein